MLFLALSVILERLCAGDKPAAEDRGSSLNTLLQILGQAIILFYNSRQHHFLFSLKKKKVCVGKKKKQEGDSESSGICMEAEFALEAGALPTAGRCNDIM